jgi:hypothetical protein
VAGRGARAVVWQGGHMPEYAKNLRLHKWLAARFPY